jgi:hypothetical protein
VYLPGEFSITKKNRAKLSVHDKQTINFILLKTGTFDYNKKSPSFYTLALIITASKP